VVTRERHTGQFRRKRLAICGFQPVKDNSYAHARSDYGAGQGAGLYRSPENYRHGLCVGLTVWLLLATYGLDLSPGFF
jgi:hypothetical protein